MYFLDTQVSLAPTHVSLSVRILNFHYAAEHFCATVVFDVNYCCKVRACVCFIFPKCILSKVYFSKVYFCKMYPTCVSSKLCEFTLSSCEWYQTLQHVSHLIFTINIIVRRLILSACLGVLRIV